MKKMEFNPYKKLTEEEKYILELESKYTKMKTEYNEVSRNKLVEKYRKQIEDIKRWCN